MILNKKTPVLILGANGFLGNSLVKEFNRQGYVNIFLADINLKNSKTNKTFNFDLLNSDLEKLIRKFNFRLIINCIGQVTNPISSCLALNTAGIEKLVGAIKNKKNIMLLHFSSVMVYGTCNKAYEEMELNPDSTYGMCKYFAEHIIQKELKNNKYLIFRLTNLYGNYSQKGLLSYIREASLLKNRELVFDNDGSLKRNFLHVKDCSRLVVEYLSKNNRGGIYNLKGPDSFSIKELVSLVEKVKKIKFNVKYTNTKPLSNIVKINDNKIQEHLSVVYIERIRTFIESYF